MSRAATLRDSVSADIETRSAALASEAKSLAALHSQLETLTERLQLLPGHLTSVSEVAADALATRLEPIAQAMAALSDDSRTATTALLDQLRSTQAKQALAEDLMLSTSGAIEASGAKLTAAVSRIAGDQARTRATLWGTAGTVSLALLAVAAALWIRWPASGSLTSPLLSEQDRTALTWGRLVVQEWPRLPQEARQRLEAAAAAPRRP